MKSILKNIFVLVTIFIMGLVTVSIAMDNIGKPTPDKNQATLYYINKKDTHYNKVREITIDIPFPALLQLPLNVRVVFEGGYVGVMPNDPCNYILGPLSPCIGIIIRDAKTGRMILAHKDHAARIESLGKVCRAGFSEGIRNVTVQLYSRMLEEKEYQESGFSKLYNGKSQAEELERVRCYFMQELGIPQDQITVYKPSLNMRNNTLILQNVDLLPNLCVNSSGTISLIDRFDTDVLGLRRINGNFKKEISGSKAGKDPSKTMERHLYNQAFLLQGLEIAKIVKVDRKGEHLDPNQDPPYGSLVFYDDRILKYS
jgi:hypothetical protein